MTTAGPRPVVIDPRSVAWLVCVVLSVVTVVVIMLLVALRPRNDTAAAAPVTYLTVPAPYQPVAAISPLPSTAPVVRVPASPPANLGDWTPARGVEIASRALSWLGWPYSWDAGNADGPTYGEAVDYDSRNDAHVRGFDCSGLVLNAMAPFRSLTHDAASQYTEAGTLHPALSSLQPGDLIFWSKNGTVAGISHVAVYIGNGNVVQAPESGRFIEVVPLNQVEPGSIGITRPLT